MLAENSSLSLTMSTAARVVGKRQVRPNLSRSDFGYVERARSTIQKPAKKASKRTEEEEEAGTATLEVNGTSKLGRSEKESRTPVRNYLEASSFRSLFLCDHACHFIAWTFYFVQQSTTR